MSTRKSRKKERQTGLPVTLDRNLVKEILGVLLVALGSVTTLAVLSVTRGSLSESWVLFLRRIFGWGAYAIALILIAGGLLLLWEDVRQRVSVALPRIAGLEILLVSALGLTHLQAAPDQSLQWAARGRGGGYIGWAISYLLTESIGNIAGFLLLLLVACGGLILSLDVNMDDCRSLGSALKARLARVLPAEKPPVQSVDAARPVLPERKRPVQESPAQPRSLLERALQKTPSGPRRLRRDRSLPPLELLNGGSDEPYGEADVRYHKQLIEETLDSFGVPAAVVEVRQGPTVTQYGVEPGFLEYTSPGGEVRRRKVAVRRILALQDDLALALAASPIRIEAPVPGRSVVGIEVPNVKPSLVSLRTVVESKAFRGIDSRLRIALGQGVAGQPVSADLSQMPHLLIAGATGSGKSVCINAITACLLLDNTPDQVRLLMVDPKMVEFTTFNGVPHLLAPVITKIEEVVRALRWVMMQMDERYRLLSSSGARHIEAYNELATAQGQDKLPYIVVLIDELADLMMTAPEEIERTLCRIAQMARATGIHLVIATQRPSVDVVTGLIKANFPARISFAVTSQVDSRVILDTGGAEKLLGRGDMLYMASDSSKLQRLQGCFVSDEELDRLVKFWREKTDWVTTDTERVAPWHDMPLDDQGGTDDLLEQAIDLARGRTTISTSFIQRQLRIGYPRAARLIDLMEEQGIIGPAENAGRSREVLVDEGEAAAEDIDQDLD